MVQLGQVHGYNIHYALWFIIGECGLPSGNPNNMTISIILWCQMLVEVSLKDFTSEEIKQVSNNFQDVIGEGWFGRVYKGTYEDKHLAVKVLHEVRY